MRRELPLIHQRRGGPGAPGGILVQFILLIVTIPLATLLGALIAALASLTNKLRKLLWPQSRINARDNFIIMFAQMLILVIGCYVYKSLTYPAPDLTFPGMILGEAALMLTVYGIVKLVVDKDKENDKNKNIKLTNTIKTGFDEQPLQSTNGSSEGNPKIKLKPPRTSQIILLVIMLSIFVGMIIYVVQL